MFFRGYMDEIKKIKRKHVILIIIYIFILSIPLIIVKYKSIKDYNKAKEDAINFLNDNITELEPICKDVYTNKNTECSRWQYFLICYDNKTDDVLFSEKGLTTEEWSLKYSNDNWIFIEKYSAKEENITSYIKNN